MKKLLAILPIAALAFTYASCNKEDVASKDVISVSSVYKCTVWEYSATWCEPCGSSAYEPVHELMADFDLTRHKAVGIFMHPSDDIVNSIPAGQSDIVAFFDWQSTPSGGANLEEGYPAYLESSVNTAINTHPTAKAGVGMSYTLVGNAMTINTKTVFFDALEGSYNLAVYVTEDKIMNAQLGQTPAQVEHNNILRAIADGKAWGTTIASNPSKGAKVDGTYSITLPNETRSTANCHVVCVIYKIDPATGKPTDVINANKY
jgi:hypothetical protein